MSLRSKTICDPRCGSRAIWVETSSSDASDCVIFLDGELYRDRVHAPAIIREMQSAGQILRTNCIYVSNISAADRHADFTCNAEFSQFLATDLRSWIEHEIGRHSRYFLCGLSLSGLAAAFATWRYPSLFTGALCQSPFAWWNEEWLTRSLQPAVGTFGRFWISVGDQELQHGMSHPPTGLVQSVAQRDSCERLATKLEQCSAVVHYSEFSAATIQATEAGSVGMWLL